MKKQNLIIKAAELAKKQGYVYMASVVKSVFNTTYCHVNKIDDVLAAGKWIPAAYNTYGWHGRVGQSQLPEKTIMRTTAFHNAQQA